MSLQTLSGSLSSTLGSVVGSGALITDPDRLMVYESDGLTAYRFPPRAVVLPGSTEELVQVVRTLADAGVPVVPRGAGTGLSGGALATQGAVVVGTSRLNRILEVDPANRLARVQPGVINAHLTRATRPHGLFYAPDPSSQSACTLGGNVAENSGGPHCLKYGVTSRYVTGLTVVLASGEVVELGGRARDPGPLDLVGAFVGSEGCFGIATEIEVELLPIPQGVRTLLAIFDRLEDSGKAVSHIISRGLLPAALEIIDGATIRAVEDSIFAAGYPTDAAAALVIEFEGLEAGLDRQAEAAAESCRRHGAREVRRASTEEERTALWKGRKKAFGAMGRIAPDLLVQDATVPRTRLPEVLARIDEIGKEYDLKLANVFHAGDGNLHPNILFDRRNKEELARVEEASRKIMQVCVDAEGTITGEHGVGVDKRKYMPLILSDETLRAMARVRAAFDPEARLNPEKVLPDEYWPLWPDGVEAGSGAGAGADAGGGHQAASSGGAEDESPREGDAAAPTTLDHRPQDLIVTVSADVTLGELDEAVRREGQWLPLDPPGWRELSVGDLLSRGGAGPLEAGYGRPRDHVLGLTLVDGRGRVLELGGKVVKNVAGYDLVRLAVGSGGALGTITLATFRLHPVPEADVALVFRAGRAEELVATARALATAPVLVAALELLDPAPWGRTADGPDGPDDEPRGAALVVRLTGTREEVAAAREILLDHVEATAGDAGFGGEVEGPELQPLFDGAGRDEAAADTVLRLALLPARLDTLLAHGRRLAGASGSGGESRVPWAIRCSVTRGRLRLVSAPGSEDGIADDDAWLEEVAEVSQELDAAGGSLRAARGSRRLEALLERPVADGRGGVLVRRLREAFGAEVTP